MRRTFSPAICLLAVACAPVGGTQSAPDPCGALAQGALVGGRATAIPDPAPGQSRRIIRPGDQVTEEFSDRRLNYYLNGADRVVRITCG